MLDELQEYQTISNLSSCTSLAAFRMFISRLRVFLKSKAKQQSPVGFLPKRKIETRFITLGHAFRSNQGRENLAYRFPVNLKSNKFRYDKGWYWLTRARVQGLGTCLPSCFRQLPAWPMPLLQPMAWASPWQAWHGEVFTNETTSWLLNFQYWQEENLRMAGRLRIFKNIQDIFGSENPQRCPPLLATQTLLVMDNDKVKSSQESGMYGMYYKLP